MRLEQICSPETSVCNYQFTLRKIPKQRWSHVTLFCRNRKLNRCIVYIRLRSETCGKHRKRGVAGVCLILRFCASFTTWTLDSDVLSVSKPITSPLLCKVLRWRQAFGRMYEVRLVFDHIFFMFTFVLKMEAIHSSETLIQPTKQHDILSQEATKNV
jgi:hypothetical protein